MIKVFIKGVLVVAFLWAHNIAYSQNCELSISGYLVDEQTGTPLAYSSIFMEPTMKGIASDAKGYFKFENICRGSYNLRFSSIGYESQTWTIELVKDMILRVRICNRWTIWKDLVIER